MSKEKLFLDIHVIQTLPPSNINRDDTGSPKTAVYGGVRRARVSSQSWKKAMRDYFKENGNFSNVGVRSLDVVSFLAEKIRELKPEISLEDAIQRSVKVFNEAGIKTTKNNRVKALFFLGKEQAENLAKKAVEKKYNKEELRKVFKEKAAIDIALFGRMLANDKELSENASSQIAHAISTHGVQTEFDYFTALDDLSKDAKPGAAMIDTIEYNSSTLYRYGNVALHEFFHQLNENKSQTIEATKLFVEAFLNSFPTGKMNSFANQTVPSSVVISLRKDRPVSFVSAFETAVKTKLSQEGYVDESIEAMFKEYKNVQRFVEKPEISFYLNLSEGHSLEGAKEELSLSDLLNDLGAELKNRL